MAQRRAGGSATRPLPLTSGTSGAELPHAGELLPGKLFGVRFSVSFLVRTREIAAAGTWHASCTTPGPNADAAIQWERDAATEIDALTGIRHALQQYVDIDVADYIEAVAGNDDAMRCPKGYIHLAADRWFCKETQRDCPIDAVISRGDLESSLLACDASEAAKATVRGAVRAGYAGLHHQAGTRMCPECRDTWGYEPKPKTRPLYYPFELQNLCQALELTDQEERDRIRREMVLKGVNTRALYTGLCADCLNSVIAKVEPTRSSEMHVLRFEVTF